jgi:hypothetical protein
MRDVRDEAMDFTSESVAGDGNLPSHLHAMADVGVTQNPDSDSLPERQLYSVYRILPKAL